MPSAGVSPWSSSISRESTSLRQGSWLALAMLPIPPYPFPPSPPSSYHTTPAFFALVLYIWQSFPCNSHPSSKETVQRHLNQPQVPVAGERCSINEAMRALVSSSAIKNSMSLSLNTESNPFTWRTQPVSIDLWRRSFYIPLWFQSLAQNWGCSLLGPWGHIKLLTPQDCNAFKAIWYLTLCHLNYNTAFQAEIQ